MHARHGLAYLEESALKATRPGKAPGQLVLPHDAAKGVEDLAERKHKSANNMLVGSAGRGSPMGILRIVDGGHTRAKYK
jgi:hypothetical protein